MKHPNQDGFILPLQWGPLCDMAAAFVKLRCLPEYILDHAEKALAGKAGSTSHVQLSLHHNLMQKQNLLDGSSQVFVPPAYLLGRLACASAQFGRRDHVLLSTAARAFLNTPHHSGVANTCELAWALAVSEHHYWQSQPGRLSEQGEPDLDEDSDIGSLHGKVISPQVLGGSRDHGAVQRIGKQRTFAVQPEQPKLQMSEADMMVKIFW